MKRKKTLLKGRRVLPSPLPRNAQWVESDSYDRYVYGHLREGAPSIHAVEQEGNTFLPHFANLLQDIFCLLFKYNVIFLQEDQVRPSAAANRTILQGLRAGELYRLLREMTLLNEAKAGLCTLLVGEKILQLLKSEKTLTRRDMLDLWDLQQQEEVFAEKRELLEDAAGLDREALSEDAEKKIAKAKRRMASQLDGAEATLRQKVRNLQEDLARLEKSVQARTQAAGIEVAQQLEETAEEAERWGVALGTGQRTSVGKKLELGRRLAGNEKLKRLARMVGRMKFQALALRKRVFERSSEEIFEVERGSALNHLLPNELLSLRHPLLRRDFYRRFLDHELLQYSLRGTEEKGKGPIVVCLDGSSSMAGDKEIWSKAVTLTLLEIARRQRRLFRSICFSSRESPLQILDLNPGDGHEVRTNKVMDLADYFPGGGTDFEKPLEAALECVRKARYKKADIVFITDGECRVGAEWAEVFRKEKERIGFSLFSILIDVGSNSIGTLKEFSDRISTIRDLTGEEAKTIFVDF